jgi:predicted Rossmann-fold nucleotide-binding protein
MTIKLNKDRVYYFASPYSSPDPEVIEQRYIEQGRLVGHLISTQGLLIINPIEMCHNLAKRFKLPSGYEFWKNRDRKLVSLSDAVIVAMMPGWDKSIGVTDEISYALKLKKQVYYLDPDTLSITATIRP